jgi:cell division protein FtsB
MRDRARRPAGPRGRSRPRGPAGGTRPVTRRPAGDAPEAPGAATRTSASPRHPGKLTGRAIVLGVVLLALALSYVFPLRVYLTQQAEIAELRNAQSGQRDHIARLEAEADRWADEEYVRIQARKRRFFVEPGEIPIIIVWDEPSVETAGTAADTVPEAPPWWDTLWSSVQEADRGAGEHP